MVVGDTTGVVVDISGGLGTLMVVIFLAVSSFMCALRVVSP